jgi:hypothetical protein
MKLSIALSAIILIGGIAAAERPSRGFRSLDENMAGTPSILDDMELRELIRRSKRLDVEAFAKPWVAAGCTVEGLGPMDRVICPGFRVDPKVAPEMSVQWMARDFSSFKPSKVKKSRKSELDGKI